MMGKSRIVTQREIAIKNLQKRVERLQEERDRDCLEMGKALTVIERIVCDHAGEFGRWGNAIRFQVVRGFGGREPERDERGASNG